LGGQKEDTGRIAMVVYTVVRSIGKTGDLEGQDVRYKNNVGMYKITALSIL
jgi:hypothetical protein